MYMNIISTIIAITLKLTNGHSEGIIEIKFTLLKVQTSAPGGGVNSRLAKPTLLLVSGQRVNHSAIRASQTPLFDDKRILVR